MLSILISENVKCMDSYFYDEARVLMASFDLKDAYYCVPVDDHRFFEEQQKYRRPIMVG